MIIRAPLFHQGKTLCRAKEIILFKFSFVQAKLLKYFGLKSSTKFISLPFLVFKFNSQIKQKNYFYRQFSVKKIVDKNTFYSLSFF